MTQALTRKEGWETRLIEAVSAHGALPFAYGASDCFTLAMDGVHAVTGERPYAEVPGSYSTAQGAARKLRARGFADLAGAMDALFERLEPAMARRGDLAALPGHDGLSLGLVIGADIIGKAERGIVRLPLTQAAIAWRVG